jgi:hypothetical protein
MEYLICRFPVKVYLSPAIRNCFINRLAVLSDKLRFCGFSCMVLHQYLGHELGTNIVALSESHVYLIIRAVKSLRPVEYQQSNGFQVRLVYLPAKSLLTAYA